MRKKGQIRMGETIAILFVFFVLILFGLIFYFQWQKSSFKSQQEEIFSDRSITISQLASLLPEVLCSRGSGVVNEKCIDVIKLEYAEEEMQEEENYYYDIFGFALIRVEKIYPLTGRTEWVLYNQTLPDYNARISTPLPVSLYEPVSGQVSFGVLHVDVYS